MTQEPDKNLVTVLLVDDDPGFLQVSKQVMENENKFIIEVACNAQEAIEKLTQNIFDVIVSDYEMPLKNGLQLLEELNSAQNKMPFILFTGKAGKKSLSKP